MKALELPQTHGRALKGKHKNRQCGAVVRTQVLESVLLPTQAPLFDIGSYGQILLVKMWSVQLEASDGLTVSLPVPDLYHVG